MIVGTGIDIVEIARIQKCIKKYGNHFLSKFLTENELNFISYNHVSYIAGRWAAKEAAVKALGTGFNYGISFLDLEILSSNDGKPCISFFHKAAKFANKLDIKYKHVSISHEKNYAIAVVILEG